MINSFDDEFSELISQELLHALTATTAAIRGTNDFLNHMFDDTIDGTEGLSHDQVKGIVGREKIIRTAHGVGC